MQVTDGATAANKYARQARKEGADAVVVITHKGFRGFDANGVAFGELTDFTQGVDPALVDVVFGDHTDIQYSTTINGILVHENRSKGATYAKTLLTIQPDKNKKQGKVTAKSVEFVVPTAPVLSPAQLVAAQCPNPADPAPAKYCDASILTMLAPYRRDLAVQLDVKVATATGLFVRGGNIERRQEVPLGQPRRRGHALVPGH